VDKQEAGGRRIWRTRGRKTYFIIIFIFENFGCLPSWVVNIRN
jgi:hypothetical protein